MLTLQSREPVTVTLSGGATVTLEPPSPRIVAAGRQAVREALQDDADLPAMLAGLAYSEGVLRAAIREWKGIGGPDGKALECTPETIRAALGDTAFFDALDTAYVLPIVMREREKNAFAASSAGTSARATAGNNTAGSPAATRRAKRTTKKKAKKA